MKRNFKYLICALLLSATTNLFGSDQITNSTDTISYSSFDLIQNQDVVNFNDAIVDIANQLEQSNKIAPSDMSPIAVSTFVHINNLSITNTMGRSFSDNLMNELFVRGFQVAELRGMEKLKIEDSGEFFITRKNQENKLNHQYTLAGTFTLFSKDTVVINARIIDNYTKKLVASARTSFTSTNCKMLNNCPKPIEPPKPKEPTKIKISQHTSVASYSTKKPFRLFN